MGDHYVDIVNENDEVIGRELKSLKAEKGFISRVAAILIRDSNGNFTVCRRGLHKRNDAGRYDLSAMGNVMEGESYENAAKRELMEELGISCDLKRLDKFYQELNHEGKNLKIFCGVFIGHSDEEPKLNHELVEWKKMSFGEIEEAMNQTPEKFCPGFMNDFNRIKDKINSL